MIFVASACVCMPVGARMYVCACVCVYLCVRVCMCVCVYLCVRVCMFVFEYVYRKVFNMKLVVHPFTICSCDVISRH